MALAPTHEPGVFHLLLSILKRRKLAGVVEGVGAFCRPEAVPCLVDALEEDDCRQAAEAALSQLGAAAEAALLSAARRRVPSAEYESGSSRLRRRSALILLEDLGILRVRWPLLQALIDDPDRNIAFLVCRIALKCAPSSDEVRAVRRLIQLLADADWMLAENIEDSLVANFTAVKSVIDEAVWTDVSTDTARVQSKIAGSLRRVQARAVASKR